MIDGEARIDSLDRIWPPSEAHDHDQAPGPPDDAWQTAARLLAATTADGGWRLNAGPRLRIVTEDDGAERTLAVPHPDALSGRGGVLAPDGIAHVDVDGRSVAFGLAPAPDVERAIRVATAQHRGGGGAQEVPAPMPGSVLAVHVSVGSAVEPGQPLVTLEAMKMEHTVAATGPGVVREVLVRPAEQVRRGQILAIVD